MNRFLTLSTVVALALLGAGCSSGSSGWVRADQAMKTDALYVAKVEAIAKRRGVHVRWVNPPRRADRRVASR
jgi:hypothetical protein